MPIIDIPMAALPKGQIYRAIHRIRCQDGDLGLNIDFTDFGSTKGWSIEVGLYRPATSFGYLRLIEDQQDSILRQVFNLTRETLLQIVAHLGNPSHMTDTMAFYEGQIPLLKISGDSLVDV